MSRRTQLYQLLPWTGGVNSSVDSGVLPENDLVQADNVIFSTNGSRLKREGINYFDTDIPAVIKRSSSGTTRTLVFASSISLSGPTDSIIVVGENLNVSGAGNSNYNSDSCVVASIATTTTTNDTITYTFVGATSVTESIVTDTTAVVERNYDILAVMDAWYYDSGTNTKKQILFSGTSQGKFFIYDVNGRRTQIAKAGSGATSIVGPLTGIDLLLFNNKVIIAMSGVGNTPKVYDPTSAATWADLPGSPPDANFMREHLGRIWTDDKMALDRLQYSATFDETSWQGVADSGILDISIGDNDPVGISAILPPFKGVLVVNKGLESRQVTGNAPENFQIVPASEGIGSASHKACVAVDNDDVYFMSRAGFHSLVATVEYGDFKTKFISRNIQNTFNSWTPSKLKFVQGAYVSPINSVAYSVAESGHLKPNSIWLYNPTIMHKDGRQGVWYRWPDLNAQSLCTRLDNDELKLVFGDSIGRVSIAQNGTYTDYGDTGIPYRIKSGALYVDGNPNTIKAFKRASLLFKPRGNFNFTAYFKVDNFPVQPMVFSQSTAGAKLGVDFNLGFSQLGSNNNLAPFSQDVVGYGRGCTIEIFQSGLDAQVEIYGLVVEYEVADISNEVLLANASD